MFFSVTLLCGRPISRIMRPGHPSVGPYGLLTRKQDGIWYKKNKIVMNVPQSRSNWCVNLQFKRSKLWLLDVKKNSRNCCMSGVHVMKQTQTRSNRFET